MSDQALDACKALEDALWECVKLVGEDTSDGKPGPNDWPSLPELAVRCVATLRADYDEAIDEGLFRGALELIATPRRPDGTYNLSREACEQLARETLDQS